MAEFSPVVEGLSHIHRIITRGINISILKCEEHLGLKTLPDGNSDGFFKYIKSLRWVTHSHHLTEDEIGFPYFEKLIEAPYGRLKDDHKTISLILDKIDQHLADKSVGGMKSLLDALRQLQIMWTPHIKIEEDNLTHERVNSLVGKEEQIKLTKSFGEHGSKNSGPGPLSLPFMFYNLEKADREVFMKNFPWIVNKVLVPIIWKGQWKSMAPFFL
jgi:hemerythrin-like domain-containing protein